MPSVKQCAGYVFAGAMLSVFAISTARAADASVVVSNEKLGVQRPMLPLTSPAAGITYKTTSTQDPQASLTVYTEGFLFCTNIGGEASAVVTLIPSHESQGVTPVHAWTFPTVKVTPFAYAGGVLSVNRALSGGVAGPYLACHGVGSNGEVPSAFAEGVFDNPFESATALNYQHLVNWNPPATEPFDWAESDNWNGTGPNDAFKVPLNPCDAVDRDNANANRSREDVACAGLTGVRLAAAGLGPQVNTRRAPTMWTNIVNNSAFYYLFRLDASVENANVGSLGMGVRDAFDSTYLGSNGFYCVRDGARDGAPAVLDDGACPASSSWSALPPDGVLNKEFPVNPGLPETKYIVVKRPIVPGNSPIADSPTPVVGAAVFVHPAVAGEGGGDKFTGDDVVFGFMPDSKGFSWMNWQ